MCYDFDKMKGSGRKLYKKMWSGTEFCSKDFITNKIGLEKKVMLHSG